MRNMAACLRWIVDDVPAYLAKCEFDCNVVSCPKRRFDSCGRRLTLEKELSEKAAVAICASSSVRAPSTTIVRGPIAH